jgi:hypothetical protein
LVIERKGCNNGGAFEFIFLWVVSGVHEEGEPRTMGVIIRKLGNQGANPILI